MNEVGRSILAAVALVLGPEIRRHVAQSLAAVFGVAVAEVFLDFRHTCGYQIENDIGTDG